LESRKALGFVTAADAQPLELAGPLDPFGRHHEPEALAERENRPGNRGIARRAIDLRDKGLVDLDPVGRKAGEVGER